MDATDRIYVLIMDNFGPNLEFGDCASLEHSDWVDAHFGEKYVGHQAPPGGSPTWSEFFKSDAGYACLPHIVKELDGKTIQHKGRQIEFRRFWRCLGHRLFRYASPYFPNQMKVVTEMNDFAVAVVSHDPRRSWQWGRLWWMWGYWQARRCPDRYNHGYGPVDSVGVPKEPHDLLLVVQNTDEFRLADSDMPSNIGGAPKHRCSTANEVIEYVKKRVDKWDASGPPGRMPEILGRIQTHLQLDASHPLEHTAIGYWNAPTVCDVALPVLDILASSVPNYNALKTIESLRMEIGGLIDNAQSIVNLVDEASKKRGAGKTLFSFLTQSSLTHCAVEIIDGIKERLPTIVQDLSNHSPELRSFSGNPHGQLVTLLNFLKVRSPFKPEAASSPSWAEQFVSALFECLKHCESHRTCIRNRDEDAVLNTCDACKAILDPLTEVAMTCERHLHDYSQEVSEVWSRESRRCAEHGLFTTLVNLRRGLGRSRKHLGLSVSS